MANKSEKTEQKRPRGRPRKETTATKAERSFALVKARSDLAMREFVPDEETKRAREYVAREVILSGRPTKYVESDDPTEDMPTRIFNYLSDVTNGMRTIDGAAAMLGIHDDTVRDWQREHPRFSAACKMGRKFQEMQAAQRMSKGMTYPTSLIFTMKNLHNWADKIEQTHAFSIKDVMQKYNTAGVSVDWDKQSALEANIIDVPADHGEQIAE